MVHYFLSAYVKILLQSKEVNTSHWYDNNFMVTELSVTKNLGSSSLDDPFLIPFDFYHSDITSYSLWTANHSCLSRISFSSRYRSNYFKCSFKTFSSRTANLSPYTFVICVSPHEHKELKIPSRLKPYSLSSYSTFGGT